MTSRVVCGAAETGDDPGVIVRRGLGDDSGADFGETPCELIVFGIFCFAVDATEFDVAVFSDLEGEPENDISDGADVVVAPSVTDCVEDATDDVTLPVLHGVVLPNVGDSLSTATTSVEVTFGFGDVF